ncbi:MAG: Trypsin-like peptidase domain [Planctomycetaceae bacterium]|nr:Trypsin-like peptidase domain [Planctomycetaceae bacterium]
MFTTSAESIGRCLCALMDPTDRDEKEILGQGCMLSDRSVLTALHVVEESLKAKAVLVNGPTGLWRASLAWSSPAADLALLRLDIQRKTDQGLPAPQSFPTLSLDPMRLGMQVGYSALVTALDKDEGHKYLPQCFLSGWVSRRGGGTDHPLFMLSPGYTTLSFSGAPVFFETGELCGVLLGPDLVISKQPGASGSRHLDEYEFLLPRISALEPLRAKIAPHL